MYLEVFDQSFKESRADAAGVGEWCWGGELSFAPCL